MNFELICNQRPRKPRVSNFIEIKFIFAFWYVIFSLKEDISIYPFAVDGRILDGRILAKKVCVFVCVQRGGLNTTWARLAPAPQATLASYVTDVSTENNRD